MLLKQWLHSCFKGHITAQQYTFYKTTLKLKGGSSMRGNLKDGRHIHTHAFVISEAGLAREEGGFFHKGGLSKPVILSEC